LYAFLKRQKDDSMNVRIRRLAAGAIFVVGAVAFNAQAADPLYEAIGAGRLDEVKRLTASADRINQTNLGRPTLLISPLMNNQEPVARYLVGKGADVNASV